MKDTAKDNMRFTLVTWSIMLTIAMVAMLFVASRKTIVIVDAAQDSTQLPVNVSTQLPVTSDTKLLLENTLTEENIWSIPLEEGIKAEHVVMENRYMDKELWVYVRGITPEYYEENTINGNVTPIVNASYESQEDGILLKMEMDGVYEYRSTMENSALQLEFYRPEELYDLVVVIDPVGGGSELGITTQHWYEKNLTVQIAKSVQKKWENQEVKLYFTRTEDTAVSQEKRVELIEAVNADCYIGICASENEADSSQYGIMSFYNKEYFIPDFGNVQLADVVTRNVTIAAGNKAVGLQVADENSILEAIKVPATQVSIGFLSNEKESALFEEDEYCEKIAEGIAKAITEVYDKFGKEE